MFNKFFLFFFVAIGTAPFHVTLELTKKNFLLVFLIEMTFHCCYGFHLNLLRIRHDNPSKGWEIFVFNAQKE